MTEGRWSSWEKWLADRQLPPELKKIMYREYGYLLYFGGIFLNMEPKMVIFSAIQSIVYLAANFFYLVVFLVTAIKSPTLVGLSQQLNLFSLAAISIAVYCTGLNNRANMTRQFQIFADDFYDYGSTFVNKYESKWKNDLQKFKWIILIAIPSYLFIIGIFMLLANWIDAMLGYAADDVDYEGEIYQRTPMKLWHPFYIDNVYKRAIATIGQCIVALALSMSLGAADVMMLILGRTVSLQLRILCLATVNMDLRALNMYKEITHGLQPSKDPIERAKDKILDECYRMAIKQLVEHHLIIQEFCDLYYQLAKWPAGFAVLNGSIMIAMSILVVIVGTGDRPSTYIIAGLLLIAEITSMWLLCETGQQVHGWSEELYSSLYEFDWPNIGKSNRKMILIFKEKIKNPLVMMAGGLTPINRGTFGTIMNTAYSYINLLRASETNDSRK
ncbi:Odorant receptor [Nesidiocoris tenuis]|uniref:Odorant receptor n=1 Tax=Nesidiocoris tenuis TaxID=355587 RepID=A0ABN7AYE2_9HEMI|nr:Odorant receptor [Nesidiocoris tenuis]